MRKFLLTAAAVCGLCAGAVAVRAADDAKDKEIKGVLIDNACAAKTDGEEKAANHPKACAMKEGCAKSGFAVMQGKKVIKLDDAGNEKAKEYLEVKENATKVIVVGTLSDDGKTIAVKEIKPQKKAA
jgi:hypothetical protein